MWKIKLSMPKHETVWGEWRYNSSYFYLCTTWNFSGQFRATCRFTAEETSPGIESLVDWLGPTDGLDILEEILLHLPGIEHTRFLCPRSCSLLFITSFLDSFFVMGRVSFRKKDWEF